MKTAPIQVHRGGPLVALVGNPNCGKTALFNRLTGSRQKVANYAGVTVERKEGRFTAPDGRALRVLDLPGAYSLHARSPDERVTVEVLQGRARGEKRPDLVVCVVDATNLRRNLRLVLAVQRLGLPCVVALNMVDLAARRGLRVDADALARELGVPVVATVAVQPGGDAPLRALLADREAWRRGFVPQGDAAGADGAGTGTGTDAVLPRHGAAAGAASPHGAAAALPPPHDATVPAHLHHDGDHAAVQGILARLGLDAAMPATASDRIDRVVLHPWLGPLLLTLVLFLVFQAVFAWAKVPMAAIQDATGAIGEALHRRLPDGVLRSLLVDGIVAGVGGVLVFLPQIVILFGFILALEESGYLPRAAFLLDRVMGSVGLSGRSFIPLLSSFACAVPGIMATRTIGDARDRLVTILIAPLMTCSARLPVYALLIGAFVPARRIGPGLQLQGLVLFGLYAAGIAGSMAVAWVIQRFGRARGQVRSLMMELPAYHWPTPRNLALGLWQRVVIFLKRVGGVILVLTVALWALASWPAPPPGATGAPIEHSLAGMLGHALALLLAPLGFNWQISLALVPGMAAREVVVSSLATVYAVGESAAAAGSGPGSDAAAALAPVIAGHWSLATALALLAWFVFAPQCLSTLAAIKRETGGWRWPAVAAGYLFALAYAAAFVTYRVATALGP